MRLPLVLLALLLAAPALATERRYVAADALHLREGPGPQARSRGLLGRGTPVTAWKTDGAWVQVSSDVETFDTNAGWVAAEHLTAEPPPPPADDGRLYIGACTWADLTGPEGDPQPAHVAALVAWFDPVAGWRSSEGGVPPDVLRAAALHPDWHAAEAERDHRPLSRVRFLAPLERAPELDGVWVDSDGAGAPPPAGVLGPCPSASRFVVAGSARIAEVAPVSLAETARIAQRLADGGDGVVLGLAVSRPLADLDLRQVVVSVSYRRYVSGEDTGERQARVLGVVDWRGDVRGAFREDLFEPFDPSLSPLPVGLNGEPIWIRHRDQTVVLSPVRQGSETWWRLQVLDGRGTTFDSLRRDHGYACGR